MIHAQSESMGLLPRRHASLRWSGEHIAKLPEQAPD